MSVFCSSESWFGILNWNLTKRSPCSEGKLWMGMPSPFMRFTSAGLVIFEELTTTGWPSRWSNLRENPNNASLSVMTMSMWRSLPLRVNLAWGFCLRAMMMLPGIWPGSCSDMRGKVNSAPLSMPCSTWALSTVSSFLHFSLDWTSSCCWTIMPGRISRWTMRTSFGQRPQPAHLPSFLPAHLRQTTRRVIAASTTLPRYMSSRLTASSTCASWPRLPPPRFRCWPPPKSMEKGSMPPPPPSSSSMPSLTLSKPPVS
mmetsp:Transcript_7141/g.24248  ORF Transcript_7141/g.24248 Transcript_7141/m.24248 type:complete len:257 (+) Transcript_7141:62-832(+)